MLARDVRVEGFTASDWTRLFEVLSPPPVRSKAPSPRGGLVAVTTGNRLRKLVSTRERRLDPRSEPWPCDLEELARRHDAAWVVQLHTGALDALMDRFGARLRPEQDLLEQALLFVAIVRELAGEGSVELWPWAPSSWPVPSDGLALRGFDLLCPDGRALAFGVFEGGEVYTAAVIRRMGRGFDRIIGPDELRGAMGLVSGDWTRDYRHLARAMEEIAPLSLGCFGERRTFRRLVSDPAPGAWAAAVAARDVYLAPAAPAVAIPLGYDLTRAAYVAVRGVAERLGAGELFDPDGPIAPALERMQQLTLGGRDLESLLGFDPITLLRKLLFRPRGD